MRSAARYRSSGGSQLFSFLDAMICTMVALLVLVHAFARHGEVEATKAMTAPGEGVSQQDLDSERETVEWRIAQMKDARAKTEAQLADERAKLSHIEDHERRLFDQLKRLRIAATNGRTGSSRSCVKNSRISPSCKRSATRCSGPRQISTKPARRPSSGPSAIRSFRTKCAIHPPPPRLRGVSRRRDHPPARGRQDSARGFLRNSGAGQPAGIGAAGVQERSRLSRSPGQMTPEPYPLLLVRPDG